MLNVFYIYQIYIYITYIYHIYIYHRYIYHIHIFITYIYVGYTCYLITPPPGTVPRRGSDRDEDTGRAPPAHYKPGPELHRPVRLRRENNRWYPVEHQYCDCELHRAWLLSLFSGL